MSNEDVNLYGLLNELEKLLDQLEISCIPAFYSNERSILFNT